MRSTLGFVRASILLVIGALLFSSVSAEPLTTTIAEKSSSVPELLTKLPSCSVSCYRASFARVACGSGTDIDCVCKVEDILLKDITSCVLADCTTTEQLKAERSFKISCGDAVHNSSGRMRAVYWSLYFFTLVSFVCRMVARTHQFGGKLWWDDWFIVFSFAVATAATGGAEAMVVFGLGQDIWMLNTTQITVVMILFYIAEFAYVIESALTKTSIVCLYLRIFPKKDFRRMCFILLGVIGLFCLVFVVTLLTYCQPFSYVWTRWDGRYSGKCINMTAQTFVCAAMNIVLDVTIFLLPIPQLLKLETNWRAKTGVILVFLLGLFVTICSIARLRFLSSWASSTNPTYEYGGLALWSLIELYAGVICACLPGMASLFRRMKHNHTEKKKSSAANSLGGSRGFTAMSNSGSAMRSFGGGKETAIMKTTSVSVSYGARADDNQSDEVELVERDNFDYVGPQAPKSQMPPSYMPRY